MSDPALTHGAEELDPTGWMPSVTEMQAEQAILGAMMTATDLGGQRVNSLAIDEVTRVITPDHLFREPHRQVMRVVLELDRAGGAVDVLTVASELEARGELQRIGGAPYMHTLLQSSLTVANAAYHAEIVKAAATRRATLEFSSRLQQLGHPGIPTDELVTAVSTAHTSYLEQIEGSLRTELRPAGDGEELHALLDTWGEIPEGAFTTGIKDLDKVLNVSTGSLVIVAARSGAGKSTLSQTIARHYALPSGRGEPVVFFSMEMPRKQLQQRDLAAMANVRADSATGKSPLDEAGRRRLYQQAAEYAEAEEYYIDDTPRITIDHIRARMRDVHRRCGRLGLVVVDYAGLVDLPKMDREDQALGELSRSLKLAAGEFDCVVILVSQLNRKPDERSDGRPKMSDLRGSGRLEQDADLILLLHDPAPFDEMRIGELDIIIGKQRAGVTGTTIEVADRRPYANIADLKHG